MRLVVMLLLVLLAGCGYHVPGTSTSPASEDDAFASWVGGDAQVLYLQLFTNLTVEPYLENYITDALVAELARSRIISLTENPALAEVRLVGEVTDFSSSASAYGSTDRITEYRATMTVKVQLLREGSREPLWQNTMQRSENYLATVNKNILLEGERLAARVVSRRLAEDIHASLLKSF